MGIFDKLRQGLFGFYGGRNDPRLSGAQNAGAQRDALINAGLQTMMNAGQPGLAPMAIGALAGRQAGGASRATTLQQGNQVQMAELFKSGEMDMRMLERAFGQATASGDFETMRALSPILSASVAASGNRGTPESLQSVEGVLPDGREVMGVFHPRSGVFTVDGEVVRGFRPRPQRALVDMGQEQESSLNSAFGQATGQGLAGAMQDGFTKAPQDTMRLDQLEALLSTPGVYEGAGGNEVLGIKSVLTAMGVPMEGLAESQGARGLMNQMALMLRNPESGFGLTGNTSDRDLRFLRESVPGFTNTPEGNLELIKIARQLAQRRQDIAGIIQRYATERGSLDVGVYKEINDFVNNPANDMFGDDPFARP